MSVISAGQLNRRVLIQQPTTVKDALGAPTQVWADVAAVWADIAPISGREARIADRIASEVSHQITVRQRGRGQCRGDPAGQRGGA
ncbi:MAG: head-tail adaptor protein [Betaproteobacteria bacterium]|nr:head-tail adaptor protein [Betaproteobacteria bacterium]